MTDGRNIDLSIGSLSGEGSAQRVTATPGPWQPSTPTGRTDPTYYGHSVIKKSPWSWDIPAYYYVGGASGASMALGAAAILVQDTALRGLSLKARSIGTIGGVISAVLLIHDLGRPSRFLHMLRVFRPTSPMSMGTWILMSFSSFTGLAWLTQFLPERFALVGDLSAVAGGVFGLALSGYTGVLVSNTVVPVWHQAHRTMPVLFLASGAASAGALFELLGGHPAEAGTATLFGSAGRIVELAAASQLERELAKVPEVVKPLRDGFSGLLWHASKVLTACSLGVALTAGDRPQLRRLAGALGTLGALCMRFGIHYAGQRSAMNPRATFHQQRAGLGNFSTAGQAAVTGAGDRRAF